MRKLSIRKRGKHGQGTTAYEVGEAGMGPSVAVTARDKRAALKKGKAELRALMGPADDGSLEARRAAKAERREERKLEIARRERGHYTNPLPGRRTEAR